MKILKPRSFSLIALLYGFILMPVGHAQNTTTTTNAAAIAAAAAAKARRAKEADAAMQAANDRAEAEARLQISKQQADPNATLLLHEGDPATFRLLQELKSDTVTMGQPVQFALVQDLAVDGQIVARANDRAVGEVVWAQKYRRMDTATILIRLNYLRVGEKKIPLKGSLKVEDHSFFGSNCSLKEGTLLKGFIGDDIKLAPAPASSGPTTPPAPATTHTSSPVS